MRMTIYISPYNPPSRSYTCTSRYKDKLLVNDRRESTNNFRLTVWSYGKWKNWNISACMMTKPSLSWSWFFKQKLKTRLKTGENCLKLELFQSLKSDHNNYLVVLRVREPVKDVEGSIMGSQYFSYWTLPGGLRLQNFDQRPPEIPRRPVKYKIKTLSP